MAEEKELTTGQAGNSEQETFLSLFIVFSIKAHWLLNLLLVFSRTLEILLFLARVSK